MATQAKEMRLGGRPPREAAEERNVLARHVPEDLYRRLRRGAESTRLPFNEYLLAIYDQVAPPLEMTGA